MGGDGDGRDSDATDTGDWIAPGDFVMPGVPAIHPGMVLMWQAPSP